MPAAPAAIASTGTDVATPTAPAAPPLLALRASVQMPQTGWPLPGGLSNVHTLFAAHPSLQSKQVTATGWGFLKPFTWDIWLAVGLTVLIFPCIAFVLEMLSVKGRIRRSECLPGYKESVVSRKGVLQSLGSGVWWVGRWVGAWVCACEAACARLTSRAAPLRHREPMFWFMHHVNQKHKFHRKQTQPGLTIPFLCSCAACGP